MGNKIKLLWFGDSPASTTGFGRVSQGTLESLYETGGYDISVLGINHQIGDPHRYEGIFKIYPARAKGQVYGFDRVEEVVAKVKPDIILINNDLWIICEYLKRIPKGQKIITYSPVDALPVQESWMGALEFIGVNIVTYTQYAKNGMLDISSHLINDISVIGHGVDVDEFYPIEDARKMLAGVPLDAFIVQNVNRNQPRKRIDLFMRVMGKWTENLPANDRRIIRIYYHGMLKDVGWNLIDLAKRYKIDDLFLLTDQSNMTAAEGVPLEVLCRIYNIADVQLMTSAGEGWGLSVFESAACGVAQIVPNSSATKELWQGRAPLIDIDHYDTLTGGINTEGAVISIDHTVEILNDLYFNRDKLAEYGKIAYEYSQQEQFTWGYIARQFHEIITKELSLERVTKSYEDYEKTLKEDVNEFPIQH